MDEFVGEDKIEQTKFQANNTSAFISSLDHINVSTKIYIFFRYTLSWAAVSTKCILQYEG